MKYIANPVEADVYLILGVGPLKEGGSVDLTLLNGDPATTTEQFVRVADDGMIARYVPQIGDYYVVQSDGYAYVNPKEVLERKYRPQPAIRQFVPDEATVRNIAIVCHETNRAYCATINDNSQPAWEDAPRWQRESATKGVLFHLANLNAGNKPSPSASHDSWLEEKRAAGWTYAPVKDAAKREHPCFVTYDELPLEQRMKDFLFSAIVEAFWNARAS